MNPDLSDSWWAKRAKRLLHPIQVQIIEVFLDAGPTQSVRDLGEVFTDLELSKLDYFVGRLRRLGAVEVVGSETGVEFRDVPYRLAKEEPPKSADRTPVAIYVGIRLSVCRRRAGLSQEKLSFRALLPAEKIGSLERGECEPSLAEVARIAPALSVSINDLLDGVEWKPKHPGGSRFGLPDVGDESAD